MAKEKSKKEVKSKKAEKGEEVKAKKGFPAKKAGGKAKKAKRKPIPTYQAPPDFKPHFLLVQFKTEKDGLLGTKVQATRYQGKFDREADDKKKSNLGAYDPITLMAVAARIAGVTYKPSNDKKFPASIKERADVKGSQRLPASTTFQMLLRVGRKTDGNVLTTSVKDIWQVVMNEKTGRPKLVALEKTDPAYRLIRKAKNFLPAAFQQVLMPPKRSRKKADEGDEE
jgi:hypothetical protein